MRSGLRPNAGFSLLELLTALALIGVLFAIALPNYSDYIRKSQVSEATATLLEYRTRLEQYYQDNRKYGAAPDCGVAASAFPNLKYFDLTCHTKKTNNDGTAGADDDQSYRIFATGKASSQSAGVSYRIDEQNRRWTTNFMGSGGTARSNTPAAGCWLVSGSEC